MEPGRLTLDDFLGGAVRIWQPERGFRAGVDSVILASAVPAGPRQRVLELGCGAGVAALCLCRRVPGISVTGLEIQEVYAELARRNALLNSADMDVLTGSVACPPPQLAESEFDQVMANPPFHPAGSIVPPSDQGRAASVVERTPLASWVELAFSVLAEGGWLTIVMPAARSAELLGAIEPHAGSVLVKPVLPFPGRSPVRVLARASNQGRRQTETVNPLILHRQPDSGFTDEAEDVLRNGLPLAFESE